MTYTAIGKSVARVEGVDKVTGAARYAADVTIPGTLFAKVLRSPLAHARIVSVDASRALALPGVRAALVGADVADLRLGQRLKDVPVLAIDGVRYAGEPVAAVAADSLDVAEEALQLIAVEYEELPGVFDPLEAMEQGAPLIHEDAAVYKNAPELPEGVRNLQGFALLENGDLDAGFAAADRVFEHTFRTQLTVHGYIEPHACTVQVHDDGRVDVWPSNKWPYVLRDALAQDLGIPVERITVHILPVGGDFGGKANLMDAPLCYLLSARTGRPVKSVLTYSEELTAVARRHPTVITLRTGVKRDGTLQAIHARVVFAGGAYGGFKMSPQVVVMGARQVASCYRVPAIRVENLCVTTNHVPGTQTRSPGAPQVSFAFESQMDLIARELGMDPVDLRLRNLVTDGDAAPLGQKWQQIRAAETLERAVEASSWGQPKPSPHFGRGVAVYERGAATGKSSALISIDAAGRVIVDIGTPETGPGIATVVQQVVAESLGLAADMVGVRADSTDSVPWDAGVGGSKSTNSTGHAAQRAAIEVRQELVSAAALRLGCAPEKVRVVDGRMVGPSGSIAFGEAARLASPGGGSYSHLFEYEPPGQPPVTSFCAQIAEVEVDPETGQVDVKRIVTAHDVGTVINQVMHQGQIDGGVVQGAGFALMEETPIVDGRIATTHLGEFKLPSIADVPVLDTVLLEPVSGGPAPFDGKAIGEIPNVPTAAAIVNAIHDAVGVRVYDLPVSPERLAEAAPK